MLYWLEIHDTNIFRSTDARALLETGDGSRRGCRRGDAALQRLWLGIFFGFIVARVALAAGLCARSAICRSHGDASNRAVPAPCRQAAVAHRCVLVLFC